MNASKKKSAVRRMADSECGYVAGMLDGDGQLYVAAEYEGVGYSRVRVRVTDECIVKHLKKITGVGLLSSRVPNQRRLDGGPKKCVYEWTVVRRADIRDLLKVVYPHLVLKKKNAGLLLELELLKDQGICNGFELKRIRDGISANSTR